MQLDTRLTRRQQSTTSSGASTFFIPDASPMIQYGDGFKSSWIPGYALQSDGYDQTLHLTSERDTISFNVSASSFTFLVPEFAGCAATLTINSSAAISACAASSDSGDIPFSLYNLPLGIHNVKWDSGPIGPNDQVIFWGVDGERQADQTVMTNVTVDNAYDRPGDIAFRFDGSWSASSAESNANFNKTLAVTTTAGASASFSGKGSAIYVYGTVGPDHGSASITLNGNLVASGMNLTSPWSMPYQLLWFGAGLDTSNPIDFKMTNLEDKKMTLDFVVLTTDAQTLSALNTSSRSAGFPSTTAGKVILYGLIPVVVCTLVALGVMCLRRKRHNRRDSITSRADTFITRPDWEKRGSAWTTQSSPSVEEVFVSYDEGRSHRLSDRRPSTPTVTHSSPYAPSSRTLPALPEGQSMAGSPTTEGGTGGSWSRPLRSLLGSSYARSSTSQPRRQTNLPPYSPGQNGTYLTSETSIVEEKAAKLRYAAGINPPIAGPSNARASTNAPSEIMSVFGQPPSERRESAMTTYSHLHSLIHPSPPARPTVDTNFRHVASPESAMSSEQANSAMPLLRQTHWPEHAKRSVTSTISDGSAARPDSDIIPFEAFIMSKYGE